MGYSIGWVWGQAWNPKPYPLTLVGGQFSGSQRRPEQLGGSYMYYKGTTVTLNKGSQPRPEQLGVLHVLESNP